MIDQGHLFDLIFMLKIINPPLVCTVTITITSKIIFILIVIHTYGHNTEIQKREDFLTIIITKYEDEETEPKTFSLFLSHLWMYLYS